MDRKSAHQKEVERRRLTRAFNTMQVKKFLKKLEQEDVRARVQLLDHGTALRVAYQRLPKGRVAGAVGGAVGGDPKVVTVVPRYDEEALVLDVLSSADHDPYD